MKIENVLVAVDFSPPSTLAVNYGVAFARKFNARLSLLHVVESPTALMYPFPVDAGKLQAQRKEQAERMLPAFVSPEDQDDLDARFIVKAGEIEDVIESVAREEQADVIVMGTHGRGLFGRLLLGSVTLALLRKLSVPVFTVCHALRPLAFNRILFATDFGVDSQKAFRFALDFATLTHSTLVVAHTPDERPIVNYEAPDLTGALEQARQYAAKEAQERFAEFEAEGAKKNVYVECVLGHGEVAQSLVEIADRHEVDFMIIGLRKKGLMERAFLGSTAEPVIRASHVPVLSVPIDTKVTIVEDAREPEVCQER